MSIRTRICINCESEFSYEMKRGADRKHCNDDCRRLYQLKLKKEQRKFLPTCSVKGCSSKANRKKARLCETHYYRLRRTGSFGNPHFKYRTRNPAGYIKLNIKDHPLADSNNYVYEHRKVVYDQLGPGSHKCFWCGTVVDWKDAVIDHFNEIKDANEFENLAYSCNNCNRARGALLNFVGRLKSKSFEKFITCVKAHNIKVQQEKR